MRFIPRFFYIFQNKKERREQQTEDEKNISKQGILDRLYSVNARVATNATMAALNAIQDRPADEQLAAIGVLFLVLCRKFNNVNPANVLNCVDNMMSAAKRIDKAVFAGIADYFKFEV